ncbi:hypothetical protein QZM93_38290 [Burkholderia cepacia]|uniref:hypothetical protein n=1 Tax=Burkholderia cepacia TaxID=292 RepID=UPI0011ABD336|nr:hypothetical protein [Burkholderia cepacia]MDN7894453.1 hypothetical protein [Burkholderia cepacia]HDR9087351.1 hypothetical protein [Burkholderia vietnamiensis]
MNFVINAFIAALLWAAAAFQSDASLSVAVGYLWFVTALTWFVLLCSPLDKKPIEKNPIRLRSVTSMLMTCAIAFVLAVYFDRVWLPAMMVIGHIFVIAVRSAKFDAQRSAS